MFSPKKRLVTPKELTALGLAASKPVALTPLQLFFLSVDATNAIYSDNPPIKHKPEAKKPTRSATVTLDEKVTAEKIKEKATAALCK